MSSFREFNLVRVRMVVPPVMCSKLEVIVEAGSVGTIVGVHEEDLYDVEFTEPDSNVCRVFGAWLELVTITEVD